MEILEGAPWASDHRDDPDVETVLRRVREDKAAYLRWGRETLGWAIYVFKKGGVAQLADLGNMTELRRE